MTKDLFRAENIGIQPDSLKLEVEPLDTTILDNGFLARNLFSLNGTLSEETLLCLLPNHLGLPIHPGYCSVGRVEVVGPRCHRFACGDVIIMPACYSSYIKLGEAGMNTQRNFFLSRVPVDVDLVQATFTPIVSFALYLLEEILESPEGVLILTKPGLLAAILLRLLDKEGQSEPYVYIEDDTLHTNWMFEEVACHVVNKEQLPVEQLCKQIRCVVVLSATERFDHVLRWLSTPQITYISALPTSNGALPWLQQDALREALNYLHSEKLNLLSLIGQHAHAEAAAHTYLAVRQKRYHGKALIYDW